MILPPTELRQDQIEFVMDAMRTSEPSHVRKWYRAFRRALTLGSEARGESLEEGTPDDRLALLEQKVDHMWNRL
jgi:hypothetical protein